MAPGASVGRDKRRCVFDVEPAPRNSSNVFGRIVGVVFMRVNSNCAHHRVSIEVRLNSSSKRAQA